MDEVKGPGLLREGLSMRCINCGLSLPPDPWRFFCPNCGSLLEVRTPKGLSLDLRDVRSRPPGVWRYKELLPVADGIEPVTLGEGGTPLIRLSNLSSGEAYLKFEGANPTGSFKDRGMTVGATIAKRLGVKGVVVASTGNTAASAAAYAARAGLRCYVILPRGGVAVGKLAQAVLHGAIVREVEGTFDLALEEVLNEFAGGGRGELYPLNSYNPWRLEGQKTIAYEVVDELGRAPDAVVVPVGNAGNISAIWKGFRELRELGVIDETPRMIGAQAEGASPLVRTWRERSDRLLPVESPRTVASAIRIGRPVNWLRALRAVEESHGAFVSVSDGEILRAMVDLARAEGVGVEPAGAASLAGYRRAMEEGLLDGKESVVLIGTGHALKDPGVIAEIAREKRRG